MYGMCQDEKEENNIIQESKKIIDKQATKIEDMKAVIKEIQSKYQDRLSVSTNINVINWVSFIVKVSKNHFLYHKFLCSANLYANFTYG